MAEISPKVWRFVADLVPEWGFSGRHYIWIDPDEPAVDGRLVAVRDPARGGETVVRRLVERDGRRTLRALDERCPERTIDASNETDIRGVVVFVGNTV